MHYVAYHSLTHFTISQSRKRERSHEEGSEKDSLRVPAKSRHSSGSNNSHANNNNNSSSNSRDEHMQDMVPSPVPDKQRSQMSPEVSGKKRVKGGDSGSIVNQSLNAEAVKLKHFADEQRNSDEVQMECLDLIYLRDANVCQL